MRKTRQALRAGTARVWIAKVVGLAAACVLLGGAVWAANSSAMAILPAAEPLTGSQPYATLLCRFSDVAAEPLTPSYFDRMMFDGPDSLDQYWRRVSYGKIDLSGSRAFGWFAMPGPRDAYRLAGPDHANLEALARDCSAVADPVVDFRQFVGVNLVLNDCIHRPRGGEMALTLDGERRRYRMTWLCPGVSAAHQIVAHEIGHSFGLTHSSDWTGHEYGNTWDVMSIAAYCAPKSAYGWLAQEPIAVNKDLLGWIPPERKWQAAGRETRRILLKGPEEGGAGYLIAEIPLGRGRMYTVEARLREGIDQGLPVSSVLIHEVDMRRENKAQLVSPPRSVINDVAGLFGGWDVGSVFRDEGSGVSVRVDKALDDGFVVTITHGGLSSAGPAARPRLVRLPDASAPPPSEAAAICGDAARN